jgi:hypothetical protein
VIVGDVLVCCLKLIFNKKKRRGEGGGKRRINEVVGDGLNLNFNK